MEAETVSSGLNLRAATSSFTKLAEGTDADVFVFADDPLKRIDAYQRVPVKGNSISAMSTVGSRVVAVVINSGRDRYDWHGINSLYALAGNENEFINENPQFPLMSGLVKVNTATNGKYDISLRPILSKILLKSISCDFSGRPYAGEVMKNVRIYLTNINASAKILDSQDVDLVNGQTDNGNNPSGESASYYINAGGLNSADLSSLSYPSMIYRELSGNIGVKPLQLNYDFYCYPNTCSEESLGSAFTRLVVEASVAGQKYYWPLNINRDDFGPVQGVPGISRNHCYAIDLKITRTGSDHPDKVVSASDVKLSCSIDEWTVMDDVEEQF